MNFLADKFIFLDWFMKSCHGRLWVIAKEYTSIYMDRPLMATERFDALCGQVWNCAEDIDQNITIDDVRWLVATAIQFYSRHKVEDKV